jgi:tetratricopeptide (TPR) repeat protein
MSDRIFWAIPASALYLGDDSDAPAVRLVVRGLDALKAGHLDEAERLARDALETARKGGHLPGEGMAALFLSNLCWGTGRTQPALELARRAREVFQQQPGPDQRHNEAIAVLNLGLVYHLTGEYAGALNEYYTARKLLNKAYQHWTFHNEVEQAEECERLKQWIDHLTGRLIESAPHERVLTLFLPVDSADGTQAHLWGEYARDASLLWSGRTLRVVPLREWLVLTADCCVFPLPKDPQVHQLVQQQVGEDDNYILAQPGDPLPDDPFYISCSKDSQGIITGLFIRQRDGTIIATVQPLRILGTAQYRPVALAVP